MDRQGHLHASSKTGNRMLTTYHALRAPLIENDTSPTHATTAISLERLEAGNPTKIILKVNYGTLDDSWSLYLIYSEALSLSAFSFNRQ